MTGLCDGVPRIRGGDDNAGPGNAGPSRNAASLVAPVRLNGQLLLQRNRRNNVVVFNEYAAIKAICAYGRFTCIPLRCLHKTLASLL